MHLVALILVDLLIRPFMWPVIRVAHVIHDLWISQRTSHWYVTHGTVTMRLATKKGRVWYLRLTYHYVAESEAYLGEWRRILVFESEVDNFFVKHPVGSPVMLRYRPGKTSRSVVVDADQNQIAIAGQPMPEQMEESFRR